MYQRVQCLRTTPSLDCSDNLKDAQEECAKWNTGIIVDFDTNKTVPIVRSFDDEERRRAIEREEINKDDGTGTDKDSTR